MEYKVGDKIKFNGGGTIISAEIVATYDGSLWIHDKEFNHLYTISPDQIEPPTLLEDIDSYFVSQGANKSFEYGRIWSEVATIITKHQS